MSEMFLLLLHSCNWPWNLIKTICRWVGMENATGKWRKWVKYVWNRTQTRGRRKQRERERRTGKFFVWLPRDSFKKICQPFSTDKSGQHVIAVWEKEGNEEGKGEGGRETYAVCGWTWKRMCPSDIDSLHWGTQNVDSSSSFSSGSSWSRVWLALSSLLGMRVEYFSYLPY